MASSNDAATPSSPAEAAQTTQPADPIRSSPAPAPTRDSSMAHSILDSEDVRSFDVPDSDLPPLPTGDDDSFLAAHDFGDSQIHSDGSGLMDHEMSRQLMDIESSFIPEPSMQIDAAQGPPGVDDTYLFGGSPGRSRPLSPPPVQKQDAIPEEESQHEDSSILSGEPPTPAGAYKTPATRRQELDIDDSLDDISSTSEPISSSPSARASQRNLARVTPGNRAIEEHGESESESEGEYESRATAGAEQKESDEIQRPTSSASTVKGPDFSQTEGDSSFTDNQELSMESINLPVPSDTTTPKSTNKRPSFLQGRNASQRSSVSSTTNQSDISGDGTSTASLGADYALQSGGVAPPSNGQPRNRAGLSRLPSIGSITSSMSGYSESSPSWDKTRSMSANSISGYLHPDNNLERLEEETPISATPPATPRAPSIRPLAPTDTVITRHVQDIQVPDTVAREFREKHARSPEKRHMATPFTRGKHNLTLKEQNSKIDKLSKENFDLKLKIHFLDQALQNRSDEGVKEMISKNVQLQTDLANEKKENQLLRKKIRDFERRIKAQEDGVAASKDTGSSDDEKSDQSSRQADMEEEIEFLRDRLETTETVVEQWKQEAMNKEADNRRMVDYIKTIHKHGSSDDSVGVNEAIGIWKDDFEEERTRREQAEARCDQAEADVEKLEEEVQRLHGNHPHSQQHSTTNHSTKNVYNNNTRRIHASYMTQSNSGSDGNELAATPSMGGTSSTLVDQLYTENEKLQRDLHAQASMLTSRNRENLRLREENEGLKLTIRRGDAGSIAGDSILERSISRNHQRSVSRASGGTRVTQMSEPERDNLEGKYAELRDELSLLKLQNKELDDQLNGHLDLLEQTELKLQEMERELDLQTQDLQGLQTERDDALQECEELKQQALEAIDKLEAEVAQKEQEYDRLTVDRDNMNEDFSALQQEMKSVSERLLQLEDDQEASGRKINNLEAELSDANQELGRQDKMLHDEKSKNERLEIQIESCQGEIDFLREEQEGDKIKIGELESAYNVAQNTIQDHKEQYQDLQERLAEERRQRDIMDSQEKQEVEKVITDLNAQLTKLKEDNRKLRKSLSGKEVEATTWKQRLDELENNLREALGNLNGTRSSLLKVPNTTPPSSKVILITFVQDITKMQRDLDATIQELDNTKNDLAEKDRLLRNRDALLESTGMESRRLGDLLERERQARRQDQTTFENAKRGHQNVSRSIQQHETRVLELETLRSQDRQKIHHLEKQYKDQLIERNNLLYALWNRLSTLCGAEWSRSHALVNGELPSMELIQKNLSGFSKNIIHAVKTVEGIIGGFRQRIRSIEKELMRDYQTLEHTLDVRIKRLDQLEKLALAQRQSIGRPSTVRGGMIELNTAELTKLRNENKTLRTEVTTLRAITTTTQTVTDTNSRTVSGSGSPSSSKRASMAQTLLRHHSNSSSVEQNTPNHPYPQAVPLAPSEQKWIHRLKELERRLQAEREARLLDRSGARKRLEQKNEENMELKTMLERERERRAAEGSVSGSISRVGSVMTDGEDIY
jgi:chromosome segregation ATPase